MTSIITILRSIIVPSAYAQGVWRDYYTTFGGSGSGKYFVVDVAIRGANFFLMLITGGAILAIMWSGIRMAASGGNEEVKDNAKKTVQYALIGVVLALMSQAIITFTSNFFGLISF
ncbi:hypothetical protein HN682_02635 [Candidatus Peregrinibacteria bacterium]|nr:hypothetical protein [Candidatus Peregrinibacteria bacterium]